MARPPCPRRIRHRPPADYFKPAGIPLRDLREIEIAPDELEAVRLRDVEDLYHEDAAASMGISRQTFDRIVRRAHVKIATALVHGQALRLLRPPGGRKAARPRKPAAPSVRRKTTRNT